MPRFTALDVLRGLAILGMCFSGRIPWDGLPAWMYHAQSPPPSHQFRQDAFGITWVDLVFPFFLFAMGVAIPIALQKRSEKEPIWRVSLGILERGVMLAVFAVIVRHISPDQLAKVPTTETHWAAIGLFFLVLLAYGSWPKVTPKWFSLSSRILGWAGLIVSMALLPFQDGKGFDPTVRADVILMVLAHVSVTGSLTWLVTRKLSSVRVAVILLMMALFLASQSDGWVHRAWNWTPAEWIYRFEFQKYLLIILPATFVGDLYLKCARIEAPGAWHWIRKLCAAIFGFALIPIAVVGLHTRETTSTTIIGLILAVAIIFLTIKPSAGQEMLISGLAKIGGLILALGFLAEPIGGGIRKDGPTTLSYFLICGGLASLLLVALSITMAAVKDRYPLRALADAGSNPMLGYVAITNLSASFFVVTGIEAWVTTQGYDPWSLTAYAGVKTLFVGLVAFTGTKLKFFLRA